MASPVEGYYDYSQVNTYNKKQNISANENTDTSNVNINFKNQSNPIQEDKDFIDEFATASSNNNGEFDIGEAAKNFGKGLLSLISTPVKQVKDFIKDPKNNWKGLALTAGMVVGSVALLAATGGAAAPLLVAAGVGAGTFQAGKGVYKIATAKDGDEAEKAFFDLGSATTTIALSVTGAKTALKQGGFSTEIVNPETGAVQEMNSLQATAECFKRIPDSITNSKNVFLNGLAFSNRNATVTENNVNNEISGENEIAVDSETSIGTDKNAINDIEAESQSSINKLASNTSDNYNRANASFKEKIVRPEDKIMPDSTQQYRSMEEIKTVHEYQLDDTYATELRNGENPSAAVKVLDNIINNSEPLTDEATVYRSVNFKDNWDLKSKLVEGEIIEDKAFGSTSKSWDGVAEMWKPQEGDGVTYRIKLPEGTKGINCSRTYPQKLSFIDKLKGKTPQTYHTYYPGEFILPRGYKLQITNVDLENGIVDCNYLLGDK